MKSITEFGSPALQKFSTARAALVKEGKTPEEVATAMGETFKLEGDKLKFMMTAADLVADKKDVRRVVVVSFAEGETAPPKYQKVDENYFLVESLILAPPPQAAPAKPGRGGPRKGGDRSGPKSSPWGASPEELALKKKGGPAKASTDKK